MKKLLTCLFTFLGVYIMNAQILIDRGPIKIREEINNCRFCPAERIATTSNGVVKWNHTDLTYFFDNGTADIFDNYERHIVIQAMQVWSEVCSITFTEASNADEADIVIKWTTGNHGDSHPFITGDKVLAHGIMPSNSGNGNGVFGDLHFDDEENWTRDVRNDESQPIDLFSIALHELGHCLGLYHSTDGNDVMYAFYSKSKRTLTTADIKKIQALYPPVLYNSKPNINITSTSVNESGHVGITLTSGDANQTDITKQGITSITWSQLSNSFLASVSGSGYYGDAYGPSFGDWWVTLKIVAKNNYGTTETTKKITPYGTAKTAKQDYVVISNSKNYYTIEDHTLLDNCNKPTLINQIQSAKLFDISGNFIKDFKSNDFDLNGLNKGFYILNATLNETPLTYKLTVN
jgi:hypothetical protein